MKKSLKRSIFVSNDNFNQLRKRKRLLVTNNRATIIIRKMVGRVFSIYSGKYHKRTRITRLMVGHHLGEFVVTKKLGSLIHH